MRMPLSLVTVIIPVYKVEKYIAKCIQSLLNQTYKNFEAIIVDDGSPDNSIQIVKALVKDDSRFIFLEKENGGLSSARNFGLDHVNGDYIIFLDSDDFWDADCLQKCMSVFYKNSAIEIVLFGAKYVSESDSLIKESLPNLQQYNDEQDFLLTNNSFNYSVCLRIYRSYIFKEIRFIEGILYEDKAISFQLLYGKKLYTIDESLYCYVQREGSIMHSYSRKSIMSYLQIYDVYKEFIIKENIYEQFRDYYERSYIKFCYFVELTHIIKYSPDYISDYKYLVSVLDSRILSLKNIRKHFSVVSKFYWFAIILKLSPNLAKRIYKCVFR